MIVTWSLYLHMYSLIFLNSENVNKWSVFQSMQCLTAHMKWELFNDTTLLSLEKIISCDMILLAKEFLYMVCKVGIVNPAYCYGLYDFCHSFLSPRNAV